MAKKWHENGMGGVTVYLDRPREIKLTHRALKQFSRNTGIKIDTIEQAITDPEKLEALYYAMLRCDKEGGDEITLANIEDILDTVHPGYLIEAAGKAIELAYDPEEDEEAEEGAQHPTMSDGHTQGA